MTALPLSGKYDRFDRAPAVPRSDRPVGPELLAGSLQRLRRDHLPLAMRDRPPLAHPVVIHRPYIEAAQLEDEEHLSGPASDASHLDQPCDKLVVRQRFDVAQW